MAAIYVITCPSHEHLATKGEYKYFSGLGAARKSVKSCLKDWKTREKTRRKQFSVHGEAPPEAPVMCINKWDIKTGRGKVLEALQTGEVNAESEEAIECWSLNNDKKIYSWDGEMDNDPDIWNDINVVATSPVGGEE